MEYRVTTPDGKNLRITAPEGADMETILAKAKELYGKMQEQFSGIPEDGVPAGKRKPGGPGYKPEAYSQSSPMEFSPEEEAAIKEVAGGNAQKERFLRIAPAIEWRGNAEKMRSGEASPVGALGPYQFMPNTANAYGVSNRLDFGQSVVGAGKYYDDLEKRYGGNFEAMLAEYNGGIKNAKAVMAGGPPVSPETREYLELAKQYDPQQYALDTTRREYTAQTAQEQQGAMPAQQASVATDPMTRRGKVAVGALDVLGTLATGAVATSAAGLVGLASLPFVGAEGADSAVKTVQDALTWSPKSDYGRAFFEFISPAAEKMDETVKDTSMYLARGNPEVATAIETGANAALILVGPGAVKTGVKAGVTTAQNSGRMAGIREGIRTTARESTLGKVHTNQAERAAQQAKIAKIAKDLQDNAAKLGIELRRDKIHDSVRRVAEGQSASARGSGFDMLSKEANAARLREKRKVQAQWDAFRAQQHFTDVSWAKGTADGMAKELSADGFRVFESQPIMSALEDLRGLNSRITTQLNKAGTGYREAPKNIPIRRQELKEIQAIRERIIRLAKDHRDTSDGAAITRIGTKLDEMLDAQFMADAAKGLDGPWQSWREAMDSYASYKSNWNEFKAVRDIIADPDMTPQKLANTILGTSSMLPGPQASRLYEHIMQLTGNSPKIKIAVQGSIMYDLMKPLLDNPDPTKGAYRSVANNIRRLRKENPELIKAMGMKDHDLLTIQHAARAAEHTKLGDPIGFIDTALAGINRHLVGHEIAQAGFRVKLAEKVLNKVLKRDATSHREMLKEFAGITEAPITSNISRDAITEAMIRGELAGQYRDLAEWDDMY